MRDSAKRHEALVPLSTEHHYGLSLCWKIRRGLENNIEFERIKKYTDWFWENYLEPHFRIEEKYVFPVLGERNVRVKKAMANHRRLKRLFDETSEIEKTLNRIEEELRRYIRYEEGILFNEIQAVADPDRLAAIERHHNGLRFSDDRWKDRFWI
ncbi:MAG TPA: hemerythrin domain-containing protein [Salinimicrobium sp.]|nr:hemerythrin domain-containing protein [Salinimicrobium sp.]